MVTGLHKNNHKNNGHPCKQELVTILLSRAHGMKGKKASGQRFYCIFPPPKKNKNKIKS